MKQLLSRLAMVLICGFLPMQSYADEASKARDKVADAYDVIVEIMHNPDKAIPPDLLAKASAVAIFPEVVKAGFVFGGKYGRGVVLTHNKKHNTWSAPAFYSIAAGSVGWQIGVQSTDLILIIRSRRGLKSLLKSEFTLGGDVAVAAGPIGRRAEASTDVGLKAEILSYSRSRGLFAGVSLEGAKISSLEKYNHAYYGKAMSSRDILLYGKARAPKSGVRLTQVLKKMSE